MELLELGHTEYGFTRLVAWQTTKWGRAQIKYGNMEFPMFFKLYHVYLCGKCSKEMMHDHVQLTEWFQSAWLFVGYPVHLEVRTHGQQSDKPVFSTTDVAHYRL